MKKELEEQLVKKYPKIFGEYGGDARQTCMAWGMTCGDGWYEIIDELCEKLEPYGVVAAQVKEKFGGLRFYLNAIPSEKWDEIHALVNKAERKSLETCEYCGKPGERKGKMWVKTVCPECEEK